MNVFRMPGALDDLDAQTSLLWEAGATGLQEEDGCVLAYFDTPVALPLAGAWEERPDQDWQQAFRDSLRPVVAGGVTVTPSWFAGEAPASNLTIVIDPGMAFGTGHHETTRMAIAALTSLELRGKSVLDVGAGTGVLAIVAAKLGAQATGVDIDPITIPIARENAARNSVNVIVAEGGLDDAPGALFDIIIANLFAELHAGLAYGYARRLAPGGKLILTGILTERREIVELALQAAGLTVTASVEDGEWLLLKAAGV